MRFYLGTHRPEWLERLSIPLFVSVRRLRDRKRWPKPLGRWALDSGGFSALSTTGKWDMEPEEYIEHVQQAEEIGGLDFAAPMDWMCEPFILRLTGLTVEEHQRRTVKNYIRLLADAPNLPWLPVLQGWTLPDYMRCLEMYRAEGITETYMGLGSVCRRQNTKEVTDIINALADTGVEPHGFGVKITGLKNAGHRMRSADSMAWSFGARRSKPLPGCTHKNCANCDRYALQWYEKIIAPRQLLLLQPPRQLTLWATSRSRPMP